MRPDALCLIHQQLQTPDSSPLAYQKRKNPHQYRKYGINAGSVTSAVGGGRNKRLILL
jgi:hypothetical protein